MTVVWTVVGGFVVVAGAAYGVVVWRGRGVSADEGEGAGLAAGRDARARQQRYEAQRHGDQGDTWQRGRDSSG